MIRTLQGKIGHQPSFGPRDAAKSEIFAFGNVGSRTNGRMNRRQKRPPAGAERCSVYILPT